MFKFFLFLLPVCLIAACKNIPYREHLDKKSKTTAGITPDSAFIAQLLKQNTDTIIEYFWNPGMNWGDEISTVVWIENNKAYKKVYYTKLAAIKHSNARKAVWYETNPYPVDLNEITRLINETGLDTVTTDPKEMPSEFLIRSSDHAYSNYTLYLKGHKTEFGDYYFQNADINHPKMRLIFLLKKLLL